MEFKQAFRKTASLLERESKIQEAQIQKRNEHSIDHQTDSKGNSIVKSGHDI